MSSTDIFEVGNIIYYGASSSEPKYARVVSKQEFMEHTDEHESEDAGLVFLLGYWGRYQAIPSYLLRQWDGRVIDVMQEKTGIADSENRAVAQILSDGKEKIARIQNANRERLAKLDALLSKTASV